MIEIQKLKNIINNWAGYRDIYRDIDKDIWDEAVKELANEINAYVEDENG